MPDAPYTFVHQVIGDFVAVQERLEEIDSQPNRRELVRAGFAAIEGLLWEVKSRVLEDAKTFLSLTVHEHAALLEESYSVDDRGIVRPQPRFLAIATSIRLTLNVVQRYRPQYKLDLSHPGWQCLLHAIEIRNRITHPKTLSELEVSDEDINRCQRGFSWFLAFVIEIMAESKAQYVEEVSRMRASGAKKAAGSTDG